jgi:hypothetical protein
VNATNTPPHPFEKFVIKPLDSSRPSSRHRPKKPLVQSQGLSLARSIQSDQAMGLVLTAGLTIYRSKNYLLARFIAKDIFVF